MLGCNEFAVSMSFKARKVICCWIGILSRYERLSSSYFSRLLIGFEFLPNLLGLGGVVLFWLFFVLFRGPFFIHIPNGRILMLSYKLYATLFVTSHNFNEKFCFFDKRSFVDVDNLLSWSLLK